MLNKTFVYSIFEKNFFMTAKEKMKIKENIKSFPNKHSIRYGASWKFRFPCIVDKMVISLYVNLINIPWYFFVAKLFLLIWIAPLHFKVLSQIHFLPMFFSLEHSLCYYDTFIAIEISKIMRIVKRERI